MKQYGKILIFLTILLSSANAYTGKPISEVSSAPRMVKHRYCYIFRGQSINSLSGLLTKEDVDKIDALSLSNNEIAALNPNVFSGLTNLKDLYLGGNIISSINDSAFVGLPNIRYIDLSGNSLTTLSSGPFINLSTLRYLNVRGNQLSASNIATLKSELTNVHIYS